MQKIFRKYRVWWCVGALVVLVLVYPEKLTVVPSYQVKLVDQFGEPMAAAAVIELWQETSAERGEHTDQRTTDANGVVSFPLRTLRSPLAVRIVGCLAYLHREGLAASCGDRHEISAVGDVKELTRRDVEQGWIDRRHMLTLTLKRCNPEHPSLC